jgi:nitrite reductase/ring-hydroxylating ferredoxin subunit
MTSDQANGAVAAPTGSPGEEGRLGFNGLLLTGVILVALACVIIGLTLYLLPGESLDIPGNQPELSVAPEEEFPVGTSRVASWGEAIVLVVRPSESRYVALEGTSPDDECILNWDEQARRVVSPCRYVVYDLQGNVVAGLTREPLRRYQVHVRKGVVFVVDPSTAERG